MKFNVGDKVHVKLWDEMLGDERVREDHRGNLFEADKPGNSFVKDMKRYCGSAAVVEEVTEDGGYYLRFKNDEIPLYLFRDWMLKEADGSVKVFFVSGGDE